MDIKLKRLLDAGQSVWLDNMSRGLLASGDLRRMIDQGVRGVTSNPTIFGNAIVRGAEYDDEILSLGRNQPDVEALFWDLAILDIQDALDLIKEASPAEKRLKLRQSLRDPVATALDADPVVIGEGPTEVARRHQHDDSQHGEHIACHRRRIAQSNIKVGCENHDDQEVENHVRCRGAFG